MINGKNGFIRNGSNSKIVKSICQYKDILCELQLEYIWGHLNEKRICCLVHDSIKVLRINICESN